MQGAQTESRYRGIGRYTISFVRAIYANKGDHEIILVLNGLFPESIDSIKKEFDGLIAKENILIWNTVGPTKAVDPSNELLRDVAELMREAFLSSLQPDIIHITSLFEGFVDNAVISIGRFDNSVPISTILYDLIPLLNPEQYLQPDPFYEIFYKRRIEFLKLSSVLLAISESARCEGLVNLKYDAKKAFNISTAADACFKQLHIDTTYAKQINEKFKLFRPYVLYTGGGDDRKNLFRLIEAYSLLPKELRKKYHLVFAGRIPEGNILALKAHGKKFELFDDDLIFLGYVSDNDLIYLYNLCELFVFPSWHEGFGLPALEAMACGAPTIGSKTTSLPELIGLNEALFDPFNVQEISQFIMRGLEDGCWSNVLSTHGLQQARQFSWDETTKRAISAWELTVNSKPLMKWADWTGEADLQYRLLLEKIAESFNRHIDRPLTNEILHNWAVTISANQKIAREFMRQKTRSKKKLSWRFEGPFDSSYSLALVNREMARAMSQLGQEVVLHSTEGPGDFKPSEIFLDKDSQIKTLYENSKDSSISMADVCSRNLYPPRVSDMQAPLNMMHAYGWEESLFPYYWAEQFNDYLQGITVMSEHCRKVLLDSGVNVPIMVSGVGVDHFERINVDSKFSIKAKKFRFLHISSCFPRKGVDVMIDAYAEAFSSDDDVSLVIKTFPNPHNDINKYIMRARERYKSFPDVVLIEEDLSEEQIKALYGQCHVLLAPSRAEGFGLPMAEAMLMGLAVITTGWSGQKDFCTPKTAWLIDYDFEYAQTHFDLVGSIWANPRINHMSRLMFELYEMPDLERQIPSVIGREILLKNYKWIDIASRQIEATNTLIRNRNFEVANIAWISTWNTACGIATYSKHLIEGMGLPVNVYAPAATKLNMVDNENITRCWYANDEDKLEELKLALQVQKPNILIIQFNYGFFNFDEFSRFISHQIDSGIIVIITLHSTLDPIHAPQKKLEYLKTSLTRCRRILVHSLFDLNRLKDMGIVDNVTLFPHGLIKYEPSKPLMISEDSEIRLASYGFFLPHKGLVELITAVAIVRGHGFDVRLDLINAEYPIEESKNAIALAKLYIEDLGLEDVVSLNAQFLSDSESLKLLERAQLILFPYQNTNESASGAVRYGFAAGRDVAVTPLEIFRDVKKISHQLPGISPEDIAQGILDWISKNLNKDPELEQLRICADHWRTQNSYTFIGRRLKGLIEGLISNKEYEDYRQSN